MDPNRFLTLAILQAYKYDRWLVGCRVQTMMQILWSCVICHKYPVHHHRNLWQSRKKNQTFFLSKRPYAHGSAPATDFSQYQSPYLVKEILTQIWFAF